MPRRRRVIVQGYPYEVIPRARESLPLPPNEITNEIRRGIFARAQRDEKLYLCNLVCMNSHDHMQVVPQKPKDLPKFYCEVLKKTTDSIRTLSGQKSLRIWEDRASVMLLASLEDNINRLVYLYCNPARAGLSDSIDSYRGISSWDAFRSCEPSVEAKVEIPSAWYRVAALPSIGLKGLSREADRAQLIKLKASKDKEEHTLVFEPFAWLKCFGITDPQEIEAIRQRVIREVYAREAEYRAEREKKKLPAMNPGRLQGVAYLKPHVPKKKERKIFLICSDKIQRIRWITFMDQVDEQCCECYQLAKAGKPCKWPPGTFIPWLPPTEAIEFE